MAKYKVITDVAENIELRLNTLIEGRPMQVVSTTSTSSKGKIWITLLLEEPPEKNAKG